MPHFYVAKRFIAVVLRCSIGGQYVRARPLLRGRPWLSSADRRRAPAVCLLVFVEREFSICGESSRRASRMWKRQRKAGITIAKPAVMDNPRTSRRDFCAQAISLVTVASLIEGCGGRGNPASPSGGGGANVPALPTISAASGGGIVTVNNVNGTALANIGSAALLRAGNDSFLAVRTGQDTFNALTAICTHEQCIITGFSGGSFVCPCHGSQFSTGGQVQQGPAVRPLQRFNTQFTNNVMIITV